MLGVPLIVKDRTSGFVMLVDTLRTRSFTSREMNLAQALVLQAANALENARLFRALSAALMSRTARRASWCRLPG